MKKRVNRTSKAISDSETVRIAQAAPDTAAKTVRTVKTPVIFIHGLWLHASSWQPWLDYFNEVGYDARAPGWPGFPDSVAETRLHPDFMVEQSLNEVVEHYEHLVRGLPARPIVVGHSFGGLVAQQLLDRDLVAAAVAIDPAPIKGVFAVSLAQLRSALPVLHNPLSVHQTVTLNPKQFRNGFANELSDKEAADLYYEYAIPAPGKPVWQATLANFNPRAETKVDVRKDRAPLLLMTGRADRTVPPETTRRVHKLYSASPAVTDLKEWPGRGHSLAIDSGWRELADYVLEWLDLRSVPSAA